MNRDEVVKTIKDIVKQVLGFEITEEDDNILGCHHRYPPIYMVFVLDKLAEIYGEEIYSILESPDYRVLCLSNLADSIVKICDKKL